MKEQKQSSTNRIEGKEEKQSINKQTLDQRTSKQYSNSEKDTFEYVQMRNQLEKMQTPEVQTSYYDPFLQTYQSLQNHNQANIKNNQTINKQESPNSQRLNSEDFMRERGRHRGHHRGHHHHHPHHMRNHRDHNKREQYGPPNQENLSDEYWHQFHDRMHQFPPNPPPFPPPYPHFHPWQSRGGHHPMNPPYPPPPQYFYGYNYQQQGSPNYPFQPNFYHKNPYPPFNYYHQNEDISPYEHPSYQDYSSINKAGQLNTQEQNSRKCEYKKRWKQKVWGQKGCWGKRKGRKHSRSRSRSSSSSSQQSQEQQINEKTKLHLEQITNYYTLQLQNFFESKSINTIQRQKILKFLIDKYPKYEAPFQKIFDSIANLQTQNLVHHMPYIKLIKVMVNLKFNMQYVIPKIRHIQAKKIRKIQADLKYQNLYGNQEVQAPIQHSVLIDMDPSNLIFLIDGNNVLPTQKHFRSYFQSNEKYKKLEAQLRFQWLVSFALNPENVFLFFDEKYTQEDIEKVSSILFPNDKQKERANKIKIIYGDETIADNKIVQKLSQIKNNQKEVILVSADRELYMRCMQVTKIKHTGGRFFFKFIKYVGVHRNKEEKQIRKLIKSVIKNNL